MIKQSSEELPFSFFAGVFVVSFCLLAIEIILARIVSVVFWYHFSFLVISIALFGMTIGALIVFLRPARFPRKLTNEKISVYACVSVFTVPVSFLSLFYLPAIFSLLKADGMILPASYILLSIPFITLGVILSLALSRFPTHIGKIYGVNLIGSAIGCVGIIFLLNYFAAPSAIFLMAALLGITAYLFVKESKTNRKYRILCIGLAVLGVLFCVGNQLFDLIHPLWVKGEVRYSSPLYSKWNYFSYITLAEPSRKPYGWGFSPKVHEIPSTTQELMILIDEGAGTVLTKFNSMDELEYLKFDVTSIAYNLRSKRDVLVVGSGGGRDLLTAVLFGAQNVTGVEINRDVNELAFDELKDFSGNIQRYKQIDFVVDEGRSYVSRSKEKYDIIQSSLVDTWAAFSSGAFALTENSLYTKEAWIIFLKHLKDNGILTFSRWYPDNNSLEVYKLLLLAKSALQEIGVSDPGQNIMLVRYGWQQSSVGVGTILVSKSPFVGGEINLIKDICDDLGFDLVLSPQNATDPNFDKIMYTHTPAELSKELGANISTPTDDRPFFFYFSSFKDIFSASPNAGGAKILKQVLITILVFGLIFIIVPMVTRVQRKGRSHISGSFVLFFCSIGLGFMFVEIPLIQRLGLFLGHPIYGFTVVLFSLLTSCGIGSYLTKFINTAKRILLPFIGMGGLIPLYVYSMPKVLSMNTPSPLSVKISLAVIFLVPLGLCMGMFFPIGMRMAGDEKSPRILYWGYNGFTSVCGSAFASVMLIYLGFSAALIAGLVSYSVAFLSIHRPLRKV